MTPNKQQLLKDFVTQQLQSAKQQTQPIVNPNGFKNGEPPAGSNWRIPGDTLYNPTPYPIQAVSDNGIAKTLNPFDESSVQFPGAQYVDEYKMEFGGLPKYQTGEEVTPTRYPVVRVTDPNDPKYLEYQKLKRLNEWSNIQDTDFKKVLLDSYLQGSEDPYYIGNISDSKEIFKTLNDIEPGFFSEDPRDQIQYFTEDIGNYGSKKEVKNFKTKKELDKFLSSRQKGEFEYEPYNRLFYKDDLAPLVKKYKPVGYQYSYEFSNPTNKYTYSLKNKKWTAPENQIIEDEINRDLVKQIYPTFTDKELDEGVEYRRHSPIYTTNFRYPNKSKSEDFYISDEHGIENLKGTNQLPKILKAKDSEWVPKGTIGYLPESIVEDFYSNYTYFPMFGTPESYLGTTYEYDELPYIPMREATKLPINTPQLKLTGISSNASPFTNMEPLYIDLTDADYAKVPANLRMDVEQPLEGQRGLRNKARYGYRDKDGTVYYERGVPGTPGYQGRFSGKPLTSKYHFVDELYPKSENSDLVVRKDGGLTKYQKAGLTFEELMMQGMRPQMAASDATYVANPRIEEAKRDEREGMTPAKKVQAATAKKKMVAEEKRQELANQLANQGTISADTQSDFDKTVQQAYNIVSNPLSSLGHYARYGYVPQGNLGNYGLRQDQSPMEMIANSVNPFAWANAAYRFTNDLADKNTYTSGYGALNATLDLLEAAPMLGTMKPGLSSFAQDINIGKRMVGNQLDKGLVFLENNQGVFAKRPKMQNLSSDKTLTNSEFARLSEIEKGMAISEMHGNPNRNTNLSQFLKTTKLTDEDLAPILQGKSKAELISKLDEELVAPTADALTTPPGVGINTQSINLERPARSQASRDAQRMRREQRQQINQLYNELDIMNTGTDFSREELQNLLQQRLESTPAYQRRNIGLDLTTDNLPTVGLYDIAEGSIPYSIPSYTGSLEQLPLQRELVTLGRTKDALKGLFNYRKEVNPDHYFTPSFYSRSYSSPKEMLLDIKGQLDRGLKSMAVGEIGTGSRNTSHNSYVNQMDFIAKNAGKQGLSEPVFLGYHGMNGSGYLSGAGVPDEEILKYINTRLNNIQTRTGTNLNLGLNPPYIENGRIMLPQYGVKKLSEGFQGIKKEEGGSVLSNFVMSQLQNNR